MLNAASWQRSGSQKGHTVASKRLLVFFFIIIIPEEKERGSLCSNLVFMVLSSDMALGSSFVDYLHSL